MTLFAEDDDEKATKKRKKKKDAPESDGVVKRLYDLYYQEFENRFGIKPLPEGGRGAKHLRDLADAWGEDVTAALIREMFVSTDQRIRGSNYKIADLFVNAQRLRIAARTATTSDRRTLGNIDAASRTTSSRRVLNDG